MEITKENINDRSLNWAKVYIETEKDCNPLEDEYSLSLVSFTGTLDIDMDGSVNTILLIKECIDNDLDFTKLPEEGFTEITLKESGEWEDVFWNAYYEIEQINIIEEKPESVETRNFNFSTDSNDGTLLQTEIIDKYQDYEIVINGKTLGSIGKFEKINCNLGQMIIDGNEWHRVPGKVINSIHIQLKEESIRDKVMREISNNVEVFNTKKVKKKEVIVSEGLKKIIGNDGVERIQMFKEAADGWNFGKGLKLVKESLERMNEFFKIFKLDISDASIFLTDEGFLKLEWENEAYGESELEFGSYGIHVYFSQLNIDGSFPELYNIKRKNYRKIYLIPTVKRLQNKHDKIQKPLVALSPDELVCPPNESLKKLFTEDISEEDWKKVGKEFVEKMDKAWEESREEYDFQGYIPNEPETNCSREDIQKIITEEVIHFLRPVIRQSSRNEWEDIKLPKSFQELGKEDPVFPDTHEGHVEKALYNNQNRIIIPHETNRIVLHGVRNIKTFEERDPTRYLESSVWNNRYGDINWERIKIYNFKDFESVLKSAETMDGIKQEGYVVCDKNFNRIKVKSKTYVALHHLKSNIDEPGQEGRRLLDIIMSNETSEFLQYFPKYLKQYKKLQTVFNDIVEGVDSCHELIKDEESQKEFALIVTKWDFTGAYFSLRKGQIKSSREWFVKVGAKKIFDQFLSLGFLD